MRQQDKVVSFVCETCGAAAPAQVVAMNAPSPVKPVAGGWHHIGHPNKPSQWKHYCDVCWHFYEPAKVKFITDWNDCVARGLHLSEELARGWERYAGGWYVAQLMGVRMTDPFEGALFYSPGNYNARVTKFMANQDAMKDDLVGIWQGVDAGHTKNLPQGDNGYLETPQFNWAKGPSRVEHVPPAPPMSMQSLQDEIIQEAILASPEFQQLTRFSQLMEQMKDLLLYGKESDVEVVLMVCDPLDGDCVKVECPKLILHGNTIEIDFPERLKDAIDVAGDKLAEAQRN